MRGSTHYRRLSGCWPLVVLTALAAATSTRAQPDFPTQTIKVVVPLAAGGTADIVPRIVGEKMSARFGHPVVIENRPGAGHTIGADTVAKAVPDGHTLLMTPPGPLVTSQLLYSKLSYDPAAFVPISVLTTGHIVLVANPKVPAANLADLIAYAKADPGRLRYASPGAGTTPHMTGEMLNALAGIRTTHVPYRGMAPAVTDLIAGHVDIMFDNLGNSLQYIRQGQLKVLAVASATRLPDWPDVPAVAETYPGFESTSWFVVVAPPKTPQVIAGKLSVTLAEILQQPDVAKRVRDLTLTVVGNTPDQAREFIERETRHWRNAIGATIARVQSK